MTRPRKFNSEYTAAIRFALDNNSAAVPLDCSLGNGKTQADTACRTRSRFVDPEKGLKDFLVVLGGDAMAAIAYRNVDAARTSRRGERDLRARRAVLNRVMNKIY